MLNKRTNEYYQILRKNKTSPVLISKLVSHDYIDTIYTYGRTRDKYLDFIVKKYNKKGKLIEEMDNDIGFSPIRTEFIYNSKGYLKKEIIFIKEKKFSKIKYRIRYWR
jgi:hypothetical protein